MLSVEVRGFTPQEYAELLMPLLIKRIPFSYEREIRIMKVERDGLRNIHVPIGSFLHLIEGITMPPVNTSLDSTLCSPKLMPTSLPTRTK